MLINKVFSVGINIFFIGFTACLFLLYFSIFFTRKGKKIAFVVGLFIFAVTDIFLSLPPYMNVGLTILNTLIAVLLIYEGKFWKKCVFSITFSAIVNAPS